MSRVSPEPFLRSFISVQVCKDCELDMREFVSDFSWTCPFVRDKRKHSDRHACLFDLEMIGLWPNLNLVVNSFCLFRVSFQALATSKIYGMQS